MSACKYKQRLRECKKKRLQNATVAKLLAETFTHTLICYVVRSCPWRCYLSSTTPVPTAHWCETTSSMGGDIRRGPGIYSTHMLMEQTQGVRASSPGQSHVALHRIHQHSALSAREPGPSPQTCVVDTHQLAKAHKSGRRISPRSPCFFDSISCFLRRPGLPVLSRPVGNRVGN